MLIWISVGATLFMAIALFRLFFKDAADFIDCLRLYFQPSFISLLRGEWRDDWWASMKLGVWITIALAMGVATHYKLPQIFPSLAERGRGQIVYASQPPAQTEPDEIEPAANTIAAQTSPSPEYATRYGIKVGDTVEISAMNRTIALRRATITAIDKENITVRSGVDSYTFGWTNVNKLKQAGKR
jgi:hypothetical protein